MQIEAIERLMPSWIGEQRWFSKTDVAPTAARVLDSETVVESDSGTLLWLVVEVDGNGAYQVPVGIRKRNEALALIASPLAEIGEANGLVIYDAVIDPEYALALLEIGTDGAGTATTVRPMTAEQSNTSLIFDERLILKMFRRLQAGANPDREITSRLSDYGYNHVPPVVATWRRGDLDLAVCQPYLPGGIDGSALALASMREYAGSNKLSPTQSLNDFGDEAFKLGVLTSELHVALADVLPTAPFDPNDLAESLEREAAILDEHKRAAVRRLAEGIAKLSAPNCGLATRVHGDFHLGQTLRTESNWYVFDFEGEPTRPMHERTQLISPLKDVAGMVRSFDYHAAMGSGESIGQHMTGHVAKARHWDEHNRARYLEGYYSVKSVLDVVPGDPENRRILTSGFEVQKAVYELKYERAYRPGWVSIPESALDRLLA